MFSRRPADYDNKAQLQTSQIFNVKFLGFDPAQFIAGNL